MIEKASAAAEGRMKKTIEAVGHQLASIRTGKATPSILESLRVDYYGTATPIQQVASIPPLSEERRKDLVKLVKKYGEEGKIALRNIRRDVNDELKKTEKAKEISEDQMHDGFDRVQKLVEKYTKSIDDLTVKREAEVMEV